MTKDWRNYSRVAFDAMKANRDNWATGNHDIQRAVTKIYYDLVFSSGYNRTGLISDAAFDRKMDKLKVVDDHVFSPQFVGRMMMDMGDVYLNDYDQFEQVFGLCRTVITVTSEENSALRQLTSNVNGEFIVLVPTIHKYSSLKIKLRQKTGSKWSTAKPVFESVQSLLNVPDRLTSYETQFIPVS